MQDEERPLITIERPTGPRITAAEPRSIGSLALLKAKTSTRSLTTAVKSVSVSIASNKAVSAIAIPFVLALLVHFTAASLETAVVTATSGLLSLSRTDGPPCGLVRCAEAYSVTRKMNANYSGPLFQLYNGSTTLDIGQSGGSVDMSTWSAFCSGVASNCVYGKIYAQINTGSNDLVPSVAAAPFGPDCSGGTIYKCAAPFSIETETGKPIILTTAAQVYTISGDVASVGINAGGNTTGIIYNGKLVAANFCCGVFGIAHKFDAGDVAGTDFMVTPFYQWPGPGSPTNPVQICTTIGTFCWGIDNESDAQNFGDLPSGASIINIVGSIQLDGPGNQTQGDVNGHHIFTVSPSVPFNAGKTIRLGGGGDLSGPADTAMREAIISNSTYTSAQLGRIMTNARSFYSALAFP
jgi:hypothetical protein